MGGGFGWAGLGGGHKKYFPFKRIFLYMVDVLLLRFSRRKVLVL